MRNIIGGMTQFSENKVKENGAQYITFGIFGIINYPVFYFIWLYLSKQPYSNATLRIIAILLCIFLALNKQWPGKAKKYLPLYWHITLTYCLPFFFTFFLLKNSFSPLWLANSILALYFLMLLVDFKSFIWLFCIGVSLGIISFFIDNNFSFKMQYPPDYVGIIITYLASLFVGMFSYNREKFESAKFTALKSIGATVAHELRTPLSTIQSSAKTIKTLNSTKNTPITGKEAIIDEAVTDILDETKFSNTIINMILVNVKRNKTGEDFAQISAKCCVEKALKRYPFQKSEENLVQFDSTNDFPFYGDEIAVVHILFNLIKNALYFIQSEKKGVILIWFSSEKGYNVLNFKDTAKGIAKSELSNVFDKFYTTTRHGTGLGLSYCSRVMEEMGGKIQCESTLNEFTLFKVKFPK